MYVHGTTHLWRSHRRWKRWKRWRSRASSDRLIRFALSRPLRSARAIAAANDAGLALA
jgi:hypothetical protein